MVATTNPDETVSKVDEDRADVSKVQGDKSIAQSSRENRNRKQFGP